MTTAVNLRLDRSLSDERSEESKRNARSTSRLAALAQRPLRSTAGLVAAVLALALTACAAPTPRPTPNGPAPDEQNVAYGEADGTQLDLDACLPDGEGPHAAVVLVHGGAFQEGDRSSMRGACDALADAGFAAFPVDYRLLPDTYPAQVDDVSAAVQWLREPAQLERFDLDGTVSLLGSSAGAIIALSAAAALGEQGAPVRSVVGLSAAGDLTADGEALGTPSPDLETVVLAYLGCDSVEDCPVAEAASPVTSAAALPPTMLVHGSDELIPVEQAENLAEALGAAGVRNELVVIDGGAHGLKLLNNDTRARIAAFLGAPDGAS